MSGAAEEQGQGTQCRDGCESAAVVSGGLAEREQVCHGFVGVLDLEAHLGGVARCSARGREDVELGGPADVAQPTFTFFDRLEAESVAIEAPRAVEVLGGELGHGVRRGEGVCHD